MMYQERDAIVSRSGKKKDSEPLLLPQVEAAGGENTDPTGRDPM